MALTRRQKQVMDFIAGFVEEHGYSPRYEEIARGLNLASLATVHKHISALNAKEYLKRRFNQSRSIDIGPNYMRDRANRQRAGADIPLVGRIAAGTPVEAFSQHATLNFSDFTGHAETY